MIVSQDGDIGGVPLGRFLQDTIDILKDSASLHQGCSANWELAGEHEAVMNVSCAPGGIDCPLLLM